MRTFGMDRFVLRPLRWELRPALWATCDWLSHHKSLHGTHATCEKLHDRWARAMGIADRYVDMPLSTTLLSKVQSSAGAARGGEPSKSLVCFPKVAMGYVRPAIAHRHPLIAHLPSQHLMM